MNFPYKYEIIVVDNGSTDGSQEFIKKNFSYVRLIENKENLGFAEGNNIGARAAKGKYLVFLNNDTQVTRNWLLNLVKVMESDDKIGICAPKQLLGDKKTILYGGGAINYTGLSYSINMYEKDFKETEIKETAFASGAAFFIRKDIVNKIGLFDKDYFIYHEDVDLSWRVRLAGYKIMYVPTSIIYHYFKFKRRPQKMYLLERNRFMTVFKNYSSRSFLLVLPMLIMFEAPIFLYSIANGWFILKVKSYLYIIQNIGKIIKKRKSVQRLRKVDDREIIRGFAPEISFAQESGKLNNLASYFLKAYWLLIKNLF
jgi:GT2 family glycosyltransferase